jgi:hypothetical protein
LCPLKSWNLSPEGVCTDDLLVRKPEFLLSAMHSRTLRLFSASASLGVMFREEGGGTLFVCFQKLYLTMFECLLSMFRFDKI